MKIKKILILAAAALTATVSGACSTTAGSTASTQSTAAEKAEPIEYTKDGVGTVKIKKYKGIEADMAEAVLDESELEDIYNSSPSYKAVSRAAKDGDTVNIDYEGTIGGEKFDGGTAEKTDLVIGSGRFIDGFEEQVKGMSAGDEKTITVTFPKEYQSEDLAGKEAQFKVKVNEVKGPVSSSEGINDEWAKQVAADHLREEDSKNIDTLDKLKEYILNQRKKQYEQEALYDVIEKIMNEAEFDLNKENLDKKIDDAVTEAIESYGMDFEKIAQDSGESVEEYTEKLRDNMKKNMAVNIEEDIKAELVVEAILDAEKIKIEDHDYSDMYEYFTGEKGKTREQMGIEIGDELVEQSVKSFKVLNFLKENSKFTMKSAQEIEKAKEESMSVEAAKESAAEASKEAEASKSSEKASDNDNSKESGKTEKTDKSTQAKESADSKSSESKAQ